MATIITNSNNFHTVLLPGVQQLFRSLCEKQIRSLAEPIIKQLAQDLYYQLSVSLESFNDLDQTMILNVNIKDEFTHNNKNNGKSTS